jgi:hypothetical protein
MRQQDKVALIELRQINYEFLEPRHRPQQDAWTRMGPSPFSRLQSVCPKTNLGSKNSFQSQRT